MIVPAPVAGSLMLSTEPSIEPGLWFVFHAGPDGFLAADLTTPHPGLEYDPIKPALHGTEPMEKLILQGGPLQHDDALMFLHNCAAADKTSHIVNDDLAFHSYRYNLIPGKPPQILTQENAPTAVRLPPKTDLLVIIGFRAWDAQTLSQELSAGLWICVSATPDIVFHTPAAQRLAKARSLMH